MPLPVLALYIGPVNPTAASHTNSRRDFFLLLALFLGFRLASLWLLRPGGFLADFSDFYYYREFAALSDRGLYPYVNIWSPYPPVFPWLLVGLYRLSLLLPPWEQPQLLFSLLLGSVLIAAEAGTLALVYAIARKVSGAAGGLRAAGFYALLFLPAYTAQAHFDSLPTFLLLLALYLVLAERWLLAGLAGGLGVMTKLLPALVFPVGLRQLVPERPRSLDGLPWRAALRYLAAGALTVLAIAAPFALRNPRLLLAPLDVQRIRPPWQTIWAVLDGYLGFGVAPADVRDLSALDGPAWQGSVPYGLLSALLVAVYLGLYLRPASWRRPQTAVAFTGLSFTLLFLFSKGWSPQYLLYLLPIIAILWPDWRGAVLALSLTFINYLESHGFLILLPSESWLLTVTTATRTLLLLALAAGLLLEYLDRPWPAALLRRLAPWLSAAAVIGFALLSGRLLGAYTEARYRVEPARPAIEYLRDVAEPGETLLFLGQADLERFYPHLHRRLAHRTLDERAPGGDLAAHLERQITAIGGDGLWLVLPQTDDSDWARAAQDAVARTAYPLGDAVAGPYRLLHWLPGTSLTGADVNFAERASLHAWHATVAGGDLRLDLVWSLPESGASGLSLFAHLAGSDLRPLAQADAPLPGGDGLVAARYHIDLTSVPAGRYQLLLGVYDPATGSRLLAHSGADHVVLADVVIGERPSVTPR